MGAGGAKESNLDASQPGEPKQAQPAQPAQQAQPAQPAQQAQPAQPSQQSQPPKPPEPEPPKTDKYPRQGSSITNVSKSMDEDPEPEPVPEESLEEPVPPEEPKPPEESKPPEEPANYFGGVIEMPGNTRHLLVCVQPISADELKKLKRAGSQNCIAQDPCAQDPSAQDPCEEDDEIESCPSRMNRATSPICIPKQTRAVKKDESVGSKKGERQFNVDCCDKSKSGREGGDRNQGYEGRDRRADRFTGNYFEEDKRNMFQEGGGREYMNTGSARIPPDGGQINSCCLDAMGNYCCWVSAENTNKNYDYPQNQSGGYPQGYPESPSQTKQPSVYQQAPDKPPECTTELGRILLVTCGNKGVEIRGKSDPEMRMNSGYPAQNTQAGMCPINNSYRNNTAHCNNQSSVLQCAPSTKQYYDPSSQFQSCSPPAPYPPICSQYITCPYPKHDINYCNNARRVKVDSDWDNCSVVSQNTSISDIGNSISCHKDLDLDNSPCPVPCENMSEYSDDEPFERFPCPICGRKFIPAALAVHRLSCKEGNKTLTGLTGKTSARKTPPGVSSKAPSGASSRTSSGAC